MATETDRPVWAAAANEIISAYEERRPLRVAAHRLTEWPFAIDHLVTEGQFDAVKNATRHILSAHPNHLYSKTVLAVLQHLPPQSGQLPFSDDLTKDVQVIPRAGADTAILLFCDRNNRLAMSLAANHRWFGLLPASLIYLRDFKLFLSLRGVPSLGATRDATLASLRNILASLGASRILCVGNSAGGFPALHYGIELGAEAVLAFATPTSLVRSFNAGCTWIVLANHIAKNVPEFSELDLRTLYVQVERAPRVRLVYGANNQNDRLHAEHMEELPSVTSQKLEGYGGHNVMIELITRGRFPPLLEWLIGKRSSPISRT